MKEPGMWSHLRESRGKNKFGNLLFQAFIDFQVKHYFLLSLVSLSTLVYVCVIYKALKKICCLSTYFLMCKMTIKSTFFREELGLSERTVEDLAQWLAQTIISTGLAKIFFVIFIIDVIIIIIIVLIIA